ncbi:polyprenyl synthetase family protein [Lampropedia aestuarii]|uniref:Polyprenyl synthetase family protein n=1 Tax=Lampropedia aestuarii TaxID=2562762 RepID=A0A4S5BT74_9BURK|nr:polyprenyl synthetase family protein [Lampropedia aestuarii]
MTLSVATPNAPLDAAFVQPDEAEFSTWLGEHLQRIEAALERFVVPQAPADLQGLVQAMQYAVLGGGKRLRGLLVLAAQQAVVSEAGPLGASAQEAAIRAASAVELIHAYSLVHDDMPCMDNDVLRRGKPTVHVQFGEARALLAGDAMQALAFELLTQEQGSALPDSDHAGVPVDTAAPVVPPIVQARLCRLLAQASGPAGMAGGQAIDLDHVGKSMTQQQLQRMHELKTGALLKGSVLMGAYCLPGVAPQTIAALAEYGQALGLAFQVVDDILDATADSATLGKTAGKDEADNKPTYVSTMGVEAARQFARQLQQQACAALANSGLPHERCMALHGLANLVINRSY